MIYLFSFFFHRRWNKSSISSSSTIQAVSLVASLERLVFSFFLLLLLFGFDMVSLQPPSLALAVVCTAEGWGRRVFQLHIYKKEKLVEEAAAVTVFFVACVRERAQCCNEELVYVLFLLFFLCYIND